MKNKILQAFFNDSHSQLRKTQIRRMVSKGPEDYDEFIESLTALLREGKIKKFKGGRYELAEGITPSQEQEIISKTNDEVKIDKVSEKKADKEFYQGPIILKEGGFGFVNCEDLEQAIFIPPAFTSNAFDSDVVEVLVTDKGDKRGPVGKVVRIIESLTTELTGMLKLGTAIPCVKALRSGYPPIHLHQTDLDQYPEFQEGDWIKVHITERGTQSDKVYGKVLEKIGNCGDLKAELDAAIVEFGLHPEYTQDEEAEATKLRRRPIERRDLRKELICTIDPFDAKDFDDALSVHEEDEQTITVGIHIADVAAYISPKSDWQERIRNRSFTAYLPGRMLPMLPKILVSKRCSLIEGEDKPAHTVLITFDKKTGAMIQSERFHSMIHVKKRLNYEQVQEFADQNFSGVDWSPEVQTGIKKLYEASQTIRRYRKKVERFLPIEAPETRVICDSNTFELKGLKQDKGLESNQLVEEFMLAANEAVARELHQKEIPGIYRTHGSPDVEAMEHFANNAEVLFDCAGGDLSQRGQLLKFLQGINSRPEIGILSFEFLRTMQRAQYSHQPDLHFGLGKEYYSHFTSPIRRYSDLLVHQQLWELECGRAIKSHTECETEASWITEREYQNDEGYRAISSRFKLHYIKQLQEESDEPLQYQATIAQITDKGLKVWLPELGLYNFLAMKSFKDDFYIIDNLFRYIYGKSNKKVIACGDSITIEINSIDFNRRELKLTVVDTPSDGRLAGMGRPGSEAPKREGKGKPRKEKMGFRERQKLKKEARKKDIEERKQAGPKPPSRKRNKKK